MINNNNPAHNINTINLMPKFGACDSFVSNEFTAKRTIWLVPHVVRYRDDSQIITWRCNWGNVCESTCLYAMAKEKSDKPNHLKNIEVN